MSQSDDISRLIGSQDHEFTANFNFDHGLGAWLACDSIVKEHGGSRETQFNALGETWDVTLYYQDSGILPPRGGETPAGTPIKLDEIREFRIKIEAQDSVGEKKANFHIRPRWQNMRVENDDGDRHKLSIPSSLVDDTDAINVRVSGSNIEFCDYRDLLMCAASAVDVSAHYVSESYLHETSNIQDAAKYVRVNKGVSGSIHSRDGPLVQLAHVLENDRDGYRKLVQNDTDERGRQFPGFYHTSTLGQKRVREVFPTHKLPKECKHYYAREALSEPDSSPLAHPKLEASYQSNRYDDTLHLTDDNLEKLNRELDETLYSILNEAGLDLRAGGETYVADEYFTAENATTTANVINLNLNEIRHEQESVVFKQFGDGLAPTDKDVLNQLVSDGGDVSPSDLADETDRHQDTVYESLNRMEDLVNHAYDEVSLKSTYVSELVADALNQAEEAVGRAAATADKAVRSAERGYDEQTSAFLAWCSRYGINYNEQAGEDMKIKLGEVDSSERAREILRNGLDRWKSMGREAHVFKSAIVEYKKKEERTLNYLDNSSTHPVRQRAFEIIR